MSTHKKRFIQIVSCCILFIFLFYTTLNADVIKLKNGRKIEGIIIEETKDKVIVDIGIGEVAINKIDIETIGESKSTDNAAVYYLRAAELANFLKSKENKSKIEEIKKNNWQDNKREIEKILKENNRCFNEVKKGLAAKKCDFDFGKKYKYKLQKELPPSEIIYLHWLLLLKGKYYENQKNFNQATDLYLSSLTFAQQISQGDDAFFKMAARIIENNTYPLIKDCLNSKNTSKQVCQKILVYLDNYEKQHFSAGELVEIEKEFFTSTMQMLADGVKQKARESPKFDDNMKIKAEGFADEFAKQAHELADRYYGNFIKAAETNKESDWKLAINEFENLKKDAQPSTIENVKDISTLLLNKFIGNTEEYNKRFARKILITLLAASLPNFKKVVDTHYVTSDELKELKSLASAKIQ